jgi:hypothetical protein
LFGFEFDDNQDFRYLIYLNIHMSNLKGLQQSSLVKNVDCLRQLQKFKEQEPRLTHKPHITKAIRYLIRCKLIKEAQKEASKRYKAGTIRPKELTDLGHELSKLIIDIDNYKKSYSNLKSAIKEHFDISHGFGIQTLSKNQLRHRLRQNGWNTKDIENYPSWLEEAFQLEYQASMAIIHAIIARFSKIISKCKNNALAKEILYNIVLDAIRHCILARFEGLFSERMYAEPIESVHKITSYHLSDRTFAYLLNYTPPEQKNKFIRDESVEMLKSLYSILSPSKELLLWQFGRQAEKDPKVKEQMNFLQSL